MNTEVVPINVLGLNQKSPRSGGVSGTLATAENVIFNKGDQDGLLAEKRKGISVLAPDTITGEEIRGSYDLFDHNGTLCQLAQSGVYGYVPTPNQWTKIGSQFPSFMSATVQGAGPSYVECTDQATLPSGARCIVWESVNDGALRGVYATVLAEDGSVIVENLSIDLSGHRPKVVATNNGTADFYVVGWITDDVPGTVGSMWFVGIQASDGATGTPQRVTNALAPLGTSPGPFPKGWFDLKTKANGDVLIAYNVQVSGNVWTDLITFPSGTLAGPVWTGWAGEAGGCIAVTDAPDPIFGGTYIDLGTCKTTGGHVIRINGTTRAPIGHAILNAVGTASNITGCYDPGTQQTVFAIEVQDTSGANIVTRCRVDWATVESAFAAVQTGICKRSVGLASKASPWDGRQVVMVCFAERYNSTVTSADLAAQLQSTFFLLDIRSGNLVSKALVDQAGGIESMSISDQDILPHVATLPQLQDIATELVVCTKRSVAFSSSRGIAVQYRQPALLHWSKAPTSRPLKLDNASFVLGGMPQVFDGANLSSPFLCAPTKPLVTITAGAGPLVAGTYGWIIVYAVVDQNGDVYRSAPSEVGSGVATPGNLGADVVIENYRLTSLLSPDASPSACNYVRAWIEIYRNSQADLTTFRLISTVDPGIVNLATTDTQTYVETCADGPQASGQPLYTTGNFELPHGQPPPARAGAVWQNRVWLASLDNPGTIAYSLDKVAGAGIQFSQFLTYRLPGNPGLPLAMNVMDEKLLVHCANEIFVLAGQPANNAGAGATLTASSIPVQFGALGPALVETLPIGTIRWTQNGPYVLGRDLVDTFRGAPVNDFLTADATTIISATDEPRTYVFTGGTDCLVFDQVFGVWSTFTRHQAARACIHGGRLHWLPPLPDGSARKRSDNYIDVNGAYISMRVAFNDINFGGVEGYYAVFQGVILGEYVDEHRFRGRVVYDYRSPSAYVQEFSRNIGPDFPEAYATASLYASLTPYAGSGDGTYQYPWFFRYTFCTALRLEIWDEAPDDPSVLPGGGFRLSNVVFEVGAAGRPNRIAPGKRLVR